MTAPDPSLDAALALRSAADCLRLYEAWAASYDGGFARQMEYLLPAHVAAAFLAAGGTGPVLDIGAGTGLLAQSLRDQGFTGAIDGVDLSADMLAQAATKGLYRQLATADITLPLPPATYRGIVSSGTFTHGHVGPAALHNLLPLAAPGALFALSINAGVFHSGGFAAALAALPGISPPQLLDVAIYGPAAAGTAHAGDRAMVALFHRT